MTVLFNKQGAARKLALEDVTDLIEVTSSTMDRCRDNGHRGMAALEAVTRVTSTQLRRYGSDDPEAMIPIDIAVEADLLAGYPFILAEMASLQGYQIFKPMAAKPGEFLSMLQKSFKETGEMHEAMLEVMAEGDPDLEDLRSLRKEILDVQQACQSHLVAVQSLMEKMEGGQCDGC